MARRTRNPVQRRRDLTEGTLRFQRVLIAATVFLAPLVFWRATHDIFGIVKAALVLVGALLVGAVALTRVFRTGRVELPRHPVMWALGAFLLLATIATFTSYNPMLSFVGHYSRFSGLLLYLAYAWLLIATVRAFDASSIRMLAGAIVSGAGLVALYGVFQELGIDPIQWGEHVGVTSTLGNPNYVSSQVAFAMPIAAWGILDRRLHVGFRVAAGAVAALLIVALPLAGSTQGLLATAVGLGVFAFAWMRAWSGRLRTAGLTVWALGTVAGVGVIIAGFVGTGPFSAVTGTATFQMRGHDMMAAVRMARENPLFGIGFDRFGGYYHAYRAAEATELQELRHTTSVPHSVHLDMFASGGFPLGLAYLAFVGVITWVLIRALLRSEGPRLLVLGGVGGGWLAYQAAALVSIDVPSLAVTGWVLGGAVLAVSAPPEWKTWVLPWARVPDDVDNRRGRRLKTQARVTTRRVGKAATGGVVVLTLVGLWLISIPVRADVHAKDSQVLEESNPQAAVAAARQAQRIAPWEPKYPMQAGSILAPANQVEEALTSFLEAAERDPRDLGAVFSAARLAETAGKMEIAADYYDRALELEPHDPTVLSDAARFLIRREKFERARELLELAVQRDPEEPEYWLNLGYARQQTGDEQAAVAAYERTLELAPGNERAEELLSSLREQA